MGWAAAHRTGKAHATATALRRRRVAAPRGGWQAKARPGWAAGRCLFPITCTIDATPPARRKPAQRVLAASAPLPALQLHRPALGSRYDLDRCRGVLRIRHCVSRAANEVGSRLKGGRGKAARTSLQLVQQHAAKQCQPAAAGGDLALCIALVDAAAADWALTAHPSAHPR